MPLHCLVLGHGRFLVASLRVSVADFVWAPGQQTFMLIGVIKMIAEWFLCGYAADFANKAVVSNPPESLD